MSCRLIVHADDFGISERVNSGVILAHQKGILTSASIMAPGKAFEHGVGLLKAVPSLDVGVHLTLIEERPLLSKETIPSLVGNDGLFFNHATTFMKRYLTGRIRLSEIRAELDRQIRKVLEAGVVVSHLDSHQHIHALPGIRSVVFSLANEYGIPAVRWPSESVRSYMLREPGGFSRLGQLFVLKTFCGLGGWSRVRCPDHFAGFFFGGRLSYRNLVTIIDNLPEQGTCELMCHPGMADEESRYTHWGYNQQDELDALLRPDIAALLENREVSLISYRDIAG